MDTLQVAGMGDRLWEEYSGGKSLRRMGQLSASLHKVAPGEEMGFTPTT